MEDGRDPFEHSFLAEHSVTLDECFDMSDLIAVGVRLVVFGIENPGVAAGAVNGANVAAAYKALKDTLDRLSVHSPEPPEAARPGD